jgi:hypothetical protein
MLRLLAILATVVAALAAVDPLIAGWLAAASADRTQRQRVETFRHVVYRNFEQTQQSVEAAISRSYRELASLPDEKSRLEVRVFAIGNSAGLFALAPGELERRLARAYPTREVRVLPLLIPDIGVRDERVLVRAALAKGADLVLLLPNLKGLILGHEVRMRTVRELFGAPEELPALERPGAGLRRWLVRHWATFRTRDELRGLLVAAVEARLPGDPRSAERDAVERAFAEVAGAAGRRDVAGLLQAYARHGLHRFVPEAMPRREIPADAPVFRVMQRTAQGVRAAGARGVAVFLPVNPLFRDPEATRAFPGVRIHDATLRRLARRSLAVYRRAGFVTADLLDALPPEAFIDLVHANAEGMERFTERVATIAIGALQHVPGGGP